MKYKKIHEARCFTLSITNIEGEFLMFKKIFSLIVITVLFVGMFNLPITRAETKDNSNIKSPEEFAANMEELPFDLIEDVETSDYKENRDSIISEEEEYSAEIDFDKSSIEFTDEDGNSIEISLDDEELEFKENDDGTIVYENEDEDYQVKNQILDGGFRQIYTLESEESPKEFKIDIELEKNQYLVEEDGLYYVKDDKGEIIFSIGKPWAVDNEGDFIESQYTLKDNAIYQTVEYTGDSYPLQADPLFCSDTINNTDSKYFGNSSSGKFSVYTRTCAKLFVTSSYVLGSPLTGTFASTVIAKDMWSEVTADANFKKSIASSKHGRMKDQFICHAINPGTVWKTSWNLEPWRPDKSLLNTYLDACNPKKNY
ncbi:DUF2599 domain-containing protein [Niallia sp. BSM11]|uniref:DUF2599 domain-containing protein n=1 Tax=Niallia sp. BSM11 TaxID=3391576 RepID=UPI003984960F